MHDVPTPAHPLAHVVPTPGLNDPVALALADALQRASAAGAWDVVAAIVSELAARRG
jgi:hypothetical protein